MLIGCLVLAGCQYIPGTEANREAQARNVLEPVLLDASSARLRNVKVDGDLICGEVNAKNRLGAYVGFRRFLSVDASIGPSIEPNCGRGGDAECSAEADLFQSTWVMGCA